MTDAAPDLPEASASPQASVVPPDVVDHLLRDHWGLSGQVFPVEESRGMGYLVDNGHLRYLLEIRAPEDEAELRLEHDVMHHIARSTDGPRVPEPVTTKEGKDILAIPIDGEPKLLHLLTVLEGDPPPVPGELPRETAAALGSLIASLAKSLEDFDLRTWSGEREDDLRRAGPQTVTLLSQVTDQDARDLIARAMVAALRRVHPLTSGFRLGLTVPDLPFDDLAGEGEGETWRPTGITDLGGLTRSWHVAALAKTCARVLVRSHGRPPSILPAIAAYHAIMPLNASEAEALWPLTIAQIALFAATAENRHALSPDDQLFASEAAEQRGILTAATSVTAPYMHAAILSACGMTLPAAELGRLLPDVDPEQIRLVDLSIASPLFYDGNWTDPDCDWKLLARVAWDTGMGSTRYGEYRLSRSGAGDREEHENFALHVDICLPAGAAVVAPFGGTVSRAAPLLSLRGETLTLLLEGLEAGVEEGAQINAGDRLGTVSGTGGAVGGLRLRLSRDPDRMPPLFCRPSEADIWRHLAPSPSGMLGIDCDAPPPSSGAQPGDGLGVTVRAWREFLYDEMGHALLDFSGKAAAIGHGHPAPAAAAYRQHLLVAAAYGEHPETAGLTKALREIAPIGLPQAILFSDQRSAMEAVVELARRRTGRETIVPLQPPEAGGEVAAETAGTDQEVGEDAAAVIVEPGPHFDELARRAASARESGCMVIIDGRRTGYGRLGRGGLWGIGGGTGEGVGGLPADEPDETRPDVAPDLLIAGNCDSGNLAVVFCTDDLADALAAFAAPISPVDAATARAALAAFHSEGIKDNASAAGELLEKGLIEIAEESGAVARVDGAALYWTIQPSDEFADLADRLKERILHGTDPAGRLVLSPPLCLSQTSVQHYLAHLRDALGLPPG